MSNQTSTDKILEDELAGTTFQGDPFLPTYNEDLKPTYEMEHASENIFKAWNLNCANDDMEEASENIFKVWDLDIPVEEGELVKQLKKALSILDDSEKGKDLKEGSLDNLIAERDLNEWPTHNKHVFNQTHLALHTIAEVVSKRFQVCTESEPKYDSPTMFINIVQ
ncbi:hypothetical protein RYX36_010690 [Vicia faba]